VCERAEDQVLNPEGRHVFWQMSVHCNLNLLYFSSLLFCLHDDMIRTIHTQYMKVTVFSDFMFFSAEEQVAWERGVQVHRIGNRNWGCKQANGQW
jgi:hypothetical protein